MIEFKHHRDLLLTGQWFSLLPAALQDELLAMAQLRRLEPGQRLFRRGDPDLPGTGDLTWHMHGIFA